MTQPLARIVLLLPGRARREYLLTDPSTTLGRMATNDVVLADQTVSRFHARIDSGGSDHIVVDLGSTSGTYVNGTRVERATLKSGDLLKLGDCVLQFELVSAGREPMPVESEPEPGEATMLLLAPTPEDVSETSGPYLVVRTPRRAWDVQLGQDALVVGRAADSNLFLDEPGVSRHHARIERRGESFVIRDLKSTNGTWLGLHRIEEHLLRDGDTVFIGKVRLIYKHSLPGGSDVGVEPAVAAGVAHPEMEIEIDQARCRKQVEEIVSSEAYREIIARAQRMRRMRNAS